MAASPPNRLVSSGAIAIRAALAPGPTYLVSNAGVVLLPAEMVTVVAATYQVMPAPTARTVR